MNISFAFSFKTRMITSMKAKSNKQVGQMNIDRYKKNLQCTQNVEIDLIKVSYRANLPGINKA